MFTPFWREFLLVPPCILFFPPLSVCKRRLHGLTGHLCLSERIGFKNTEHHFHQVSCWYSQIKVHKVRNKMPSHFSIFALKYITPPAGSQPSELSWKVLPRRNENPHISQESALHASVWLSGLRVLWWSADPSRLYSCLSPGDPRTKQTVKHCCGDHCFSARFPEHQVDCLINSGLFEVSHNKEIAFFPRLHLKRRSPRWVLVIRRL